MGCDVNEIEFFTLEHLLGRNIGPVGKPLRPVQA